MNLDIAQLRAMIICSSKIKLVRQVSNYLKGYIRAVLMQALMYLRSTDHV